MGTYTYWEFYEEFGGEPDRDEAVPSLEDADALRDDDLDRRMDRYMADRDAAIEGAIEYGRVDPDDTRKFIGPGIFWNPKLVDEGEVW